MVKDVLKNANVASGL